MRVLYVSKALHVAADYDDFDDLWAGFASGVGPSGAFCTALDEERRERLGSVLTAVTASPATGR